MLPSCARGSSVARNEHEEWRSILLHILFSSVIDWCCCNSGVAFPLLEVNPLVPEICSYYSNCVKLNYLFCTGPSIVMPSRSTTLTLTLRFLDRPLNRFLAMHEILLAHWGNLFPSILVWLLVLKQVHRQNLMKGSCTLFREVFQAATPSKNMCTLYQIWLV